MDRNSRRCLECSNYGKKRNLMPSGYVRRWAPGHPTAHASGYALEHRWMLHEMAIPLPAGHHVHHRNGDPQDNRWSNLEVLAPARHRAEHAPPGAPVQNQHGLSTVALDDAERRERVRKRNARRYLAA